MLELPKGTNLAFHALAALAKQPSETLGIARIAESLGASPSYMAHLFQRLVREGLLVSQRGTGGGYGLARPPQEITLWDVIVALSDREQGNTADLEDCATCPLASACPVKTSLQCAKEKLAEIFLQVRVDMLIV